MKAKGIAKPIVASLAGDVQVEEAAEYLYDHGIPAYAYSTEIPVAVLGAKYDGRAGPASSEAVAARGASGVLREPGCGHGGIIP